MTSRSQFVTIAILAVACFMTAGALTLARAQQADAKPAPLPTLPVRVDVTLTRYQGEKKVSSLPFSLYASAGRYGDNRVSMRMGIDVPVGTSTATETRTVPTNSAATATQATSTTSTKTEYRSVGTNIDSMVARVDETRFSVFVNVNDSSVYTADGDAKNLRNIDAAAFRTFSTSNTVILRDGQTLLFGTGTDKVSGEVLKIEVTLTVIK